MDDAAGNAEAHRAPPPARLYRHRLATRLWHWTNVVAVFTLLMSGLMIFNAHPRLYWGHKGTETDPAWMEIGATAEGGFLRVGSISIPTTGVLGQWRDGKGVVQNTAFPGWATIPSYYSLAMARRWHLTFAWLFAWGLFLFMIASLINRHFRRDLGVGRDDLSPRNLWADLRAHLRFDFHSHDTGAFNRLQKLSYVGVIIVLLPLMIFTGLAMSPGMDAAWPWLIDIFGGRQSARSIHFIAAFLLLSFIIIHLIMVVLSGPVNQIRAMITGWYRLPPSGQDKA